jgi:hypothetical protein
MASNQAGESAGPFQVGDLVECTNAGDCAAGSLTVGRSYIVQEVNAMHDSISVLINPWDIAAFGDFRFKLVERPASPIYVAPSTDNVYRPNHYARFVIEPLTFVNANSLPFNIGNVIKYVCRYDAKNGREDLEKAKRYIDIQLECMARDDRVNKGGEDKNVVWKDCL